jgi:hypothetical protein
MQFFVRVVVKAHTNKQKVLNLSFFFFFLFFDYFNFNVSVNPEVEANSLPQVLHLALVSVVFGYSLVSALLWIDKVNQLFFYTVLYEICLQTVTPNS